MEIHHIMYMCIIIRITTYSGSIPYHSLQLLGVIEGMIEEQLPNAQQVVHLEHLTQAGNRV